MNVNRAIRARELRVIGPEGEQLGILTLAEALAAAETRELDLVEVSPTAVPPVCRIMDYGKFKYQQSKKLQEARKKTSHVVVKEVKLRPKTDSHDIATKVKHIRRFLEEGNKANVTLRFRGREITHTELGIKILDKVAEDLQDVALIELKPKMEGRSLFMIVAPKK